MSDGRVVIIVELGDNCVGPIVIWSRL